MVHSVSPENDINLAKNDLQISKSLVSLCTRNNKQIVCHTGNRTRGHTIKTRSVNHFTNRGWFLSASGLQTWSSLEQRFELLRTKLLDPPNVTRYVLEVLPRCRRGRDNHFLGHAVAFPVLHDVAVARRRGRGDGDGSIRRHWDGVIGKRTPPGDGFEVRRRGREVGAVVHDGSIGTTEGGCVNDHRLGGAGSGGRTSPSSSSPSSLPSYPSRFCVRFRAQSRY